MMILRRWLAWSSWPSLLLAGCSDGRRDVPGGPVRLLVFGAPGGAGGLPNARRRLREGARPARTFSSIEASDRNDLIARLSTSIAGGSPPDLFLMNYRFYGQFAAKDAIEPVDERLRDSDAFEPADFYPEAMDAFRGRASSSACRRTSRASSSTTTGTCSRRYGVAEPRAGLDLGRVRRARRAPLTRDAERQQVVRRRVRGRGAARSAVYGLGVEPAMIRLAPFVWSNGGEHRRQRRDSRPGSPSTPRPRARRCRTSSTCARRYGVVPTDEEVEAEDDESRFANGRLAMLLSSRRATPTFRAITRLRLGRRPAAGAPQPAGILHSDAYCMTRGSNDKDAPGDFIEFALGPEGQRIVAAHRADRAVARSRSRSLRRLPRPVAAAAQLPGLPRRHPDPPPRADDLDLAGDRGRHRRGSWRTRCTVGDAGRRGGPRAGRGDAAAVCARRDRPERLAARGRDEGATRDARTRCTASTRGRRTASCSPCSGRPVREVDAAPRGRRARGGERRAAS